MHIVVDLDGVLRGHTNDAPIAEGILITGALSAYNQISIITELNPLAITQWLNQNKVVDFDHIIDSSYSLEGEVLKHRQILAARAKSKVDLFITASPTLWAFAFEQGIPSLMFGVPSYLRAEFRPDAPKAIRAWDDIAAAVSKQNELRTQDARVKRTETVRFD
jgi:hypothetical protein